MPSEQAIDVADRDSIAMMRCGAELASAGEPMIAAAICWRRSGTAGGGRTNDAAYELPEQEHAMTEIAAGKPDSDGPSAGFPRRRLRFAVRSTGPLPAAQSDICAHALANHQLGDR